MSEDLTPEKKDAFRDKYFPKIFAGFAICGVAFYLLQRLNRMQEAFALSDTGAERIKAWAAGLFLVSFALVLINMIRLLTTWNPTALDWLDKERNTRLRYVYPWLLAIVFVLLFELVLQARLPG